LPKIKITENAFEFSSIISAFPNFWNTRIAVVGNKPWPSLIRRFFFQYFESKLDSTFDVKYTHKYTISVVPNPHFDRKLQSFYQVGFPFSQIMYGLMFSLRTVAWKSPARNKF